MNSPSARAQLDALIAEERPGVVIVGAGATAQDLAPYVSDEWEIWGCNSLVRPFVEWDGIKVAAHRWFQIHPINVCSDAEKVWAKICPLPIYCVPHTRAADAPMAVSYPLDDANRLSLAVAGFASTFAYEVALAILEGKDRIHLAGLAYSVGGTVREVIVEGPNLMWWAAGAVGKGIEVTSQGGFDPGIAMLGWHYGFDYFEERNAVREYARKIRREIMTRNIDGDV